MTQFLIKKNSEEVQPMFTQMLFKNQILRFFAIAVLIGLIAFPIGLSAQSRDDGLPSFYPMKFDGKGFINRIDSQEIVINDTEYKLARRPIYNTPRTRGSSSYNFQKGSIVGYILNDDQEVASLWLLKDKIDE